MHAFYGSGVIGPDVLFSQQLVSTVTNESCGDTLSGVDEPVDAAKLDVEAMPFGEQVLSVCEF